MIPMQEMLIWMRCCYRRVYGFELVNNVIDVMMLVMTYFDDAKVMDVDVGDIV